MVIDHWKCVIYKIIFTVCEEIEYAANDHITRPGKDGRWGGGGEEEGASDLSG